MNKKGSIYLKKINPQTLFIFLGAIFIFLIILSVNIINVTSRGVVGDIEKGLIGHWPLNGTYDTKDITPYGNNGSAMSATLSTGIKGEGNGSYDFGTINDGFSINIPNKNFAGLYDFSMSAWIYLKGPQLHYDGTIISSGNWNSSHWSFGISQGNTSIKTRNPGATASYAFALNTWYNVIYIRQGTSLKFYVNGILISTQTNSANIPLSSDYTNTKIGMDTYTSNYFNFNGKITDVRIYNRAISATEAKSLFERYQPTLGASSFSKGLIAHYPLNIETGAKDITPNAKVGTIVGATLTTGRKGESNGAYSFNGTSNYIRTGTIPQSNYFSISIWFKTSATSGNLYWGNGTDKAIIALASGNKLSWYVRTSVGPVGYKTSLSSFIPNVWNNAVLVYDGSQVSLYINGVKDSVTGSITGYSAASAINIGTNYNVSGAFFNGSITDFKFYDRALSDEEIKTAYDSLDSKLSTGTLNKGLVLNMPLTNGFMKSSSIVSDNTPYGNDGNISGAIIGDDNVSFDGVDDYIDLGNNINLGYGSFSISIWANASQLGTTKFLIGKTNGASSSSSIGYSLVLGNVGTQWGFGVWDGVNNTYILSPTSTITNTWYLITGTYDSITGLTKLYINGSEKKNATKIIGNKDVANSLYVGKILTSNSYVFNGYLSGARIWNRVLTDDEVKLLYDRGRN